MLRNFSTKNVSLMSFSLVGQWKTSSTWLDLMLEKNLAPLCYVMLCYVGRSASVRMSSHFSSEFQSGFNADTDGREHKVEKLISPEAEVRWLLVQAKQNLSLPFNVKWENFRTHQIGSSNEIWSKEHLHASKFNAWDKMIYYQIRGSFLLGRKDIYQGSGWMSS